MTSEHIVYKLGIPGYQKGNKALAAAIELAAQDPEIIYCAMSKLYPEVARRLGGTTQQVQRNIRTSINTCWENENHDFLNMIARHKLMRKPRPLALIGWAADYLIWANSKNPTMV